MALSAEQVIDTSRKILELREGEQRRLNKIFRYMQGEHETVYVPKGARGEYRWLIRQATVNILPMIVTAVAQNLRIDGYRAADDTDNAAAWEHWQSNRMDARQHGVHRAALTYGASYVVVLPGKNPRSGKKGSVIRPVSPRRMTALYEDPINDEFPQYAVEDTIENTVFGQVRVVHVYDNTSRYTLKGDAKRPNEPMQLASTEDHGMKVCPVVRFVNQVDLDGVIDVTGEVEPLFRLQNQLNFTTFNLMLAQQFSAFRQRWVTGMAPPLDDNGVSYEPFKSGVDRLFMAEDADTKFGEFGQTDLSGYLSTREATIKEIAMVSQTPPHYLLGQMVNLSADALVAAESGLFRKIVERQATFGEAWEQVLRLAALAAGDINAMDDTSSEVVWRDTEARSLSQTADALGKLATQLEIPKAELWARIPGVTQQELERWKAAAQEANALGQLDAAIARQMGTEVAPTLRDTNTTTTNDTPGATAPATPAKKPATIGVPAAPVRKPAKAVPAGK